MTIEHKAIYRNLMLCGATALALTACGNLPDADLRNFGGGFNTAEAGQRATLDRPQPDSRGIISYPGYQVAIAKRGDTIATVADRLGLSAGELARFNGLNATTQLSDGEVVALPSRVAEPTAASGAAPLGGAPGQIDITSLASGAINRASPGASDGGSSGGIQQSTLSSQPGAIKSSSTSPVVQPGKQPLRHKVLRGETAYSIARLYNIPVRSLADWNGLGPDLAVHDGQYLLIPLVDESKPAPAPVAEVSAPGQTSALPEPPSASKPLPTTSPPPASAPTPVPKSPDLGANRTAASASAFAMPVDGKVIKPYSTKSGGIDLSATAGAPIKAAADGTVVRVTQDTSGVTVILLSHPGDYYTIYAPVADTKVKQGQSVKRGQTIAAVGQGNPASMHFEIRKGIANTIDPMSVLQ